MVPLKGSSGWRANRVSTKFVTSSFVVSIIFLSLAVYSVDVGRRALEDTVGEESVEMARSFALAIDRGIYSKLHELVILSLGNTARTFLNISNAEFDAMADPELYIDLQEAEWTAAPEDELTPFMESILLNNYSLDLMNRLKLHYVSEHGMDVYGEVQVSNKYGAVIAMTSRSTDYRQSDEVWWQSARDNETFVGEIEFDSNLGRHGLPVCTSVLNADGDFIGVMRAVVGAAEIVMEAQFESHVFETTEVDVLTPDMKLVFATHAYLPFDDMSSATYAAHIEGDYGYFLAEEAGRERLYSYSTSPGYIEYEGSSWIFVMSHDSEEVLSSATSLRSEILAMSLVLLIAFLLVALVLSVSITRPLMKLKNAALSMASGNLGERVNIKSRDELGELAGAFNTMAIELNGLYIDLEKRVRERTKELEAANAKLSLLGSITRHDALNQLSVLRGWLSILSEDCDNDETLARIEKVKLASETLEELLKFTGDYEKVGITRPVWTDAKLALETGMPGVDLKGARLVNQLDDLKVYADPMFPRVLRNLADNAIKHGHKTTRVSFTYQENPDGLVIAIEDDGVGVPSERKEQIFERVRDKTTGRTGFGLYLSRAILAITDITVREVGTPGDGARFEIFVPRGNYRISKDSLSEENDV